jgi:hypothetical protein
MALGGREAPRDHLRLARTLCAPGQVGLAPTHIAAGVIAVAAMTDPDPTAGKGFERCAGPE